MRCPALPFQPLICSMSSSWTTCTMRRRRKAPNPAAPRWWLKSLISSVPTLGNNSCVTGASKPLMSSSPPIRRNRGARPDSSPMPFGIALTACQAPPSSNMWRPFCSNCRRSDTQRSMLTKLLGDVFLQADWPRMTGRPLSKLAWLQIPRSLPCATSSVTSSGEASGMLRPCLCRPRRSWRTGPCMCYEILGIAARWRCFFPFWDPMSRYWTWVREWRAEQRG